MTHITRRHFTKATAAAGIATALSASRVYGANDRVRVGFIGLGNRGDQVLDAFLEHKDAQVVAICDIYQPYLDFAAKKIGGNPEQFHDYRKLLDRKDLDAVVVGHARPLARLADDPGLPGGQGRVRRKAAVAVRGRRPGDGQGGPRAQARGRRSASSGCRAPSARKRPRSSASGGIGKVTVVRALPRPERVAQGHRQPARRGSAERLRLGRLARARPRSGRTTRTAPSTASAGSTTTPAASSPTSASTTSTRSTARSASTTPLSVAAMGGKFANYDNREVPDTLEVIWQYPGNTLVTFSQFNANGGARLAAGLARSSSAAPRERCTSAPAATRWCPK